MQIARTVRHILHRIYHLHDLRILRDVVVLDSLLQEFRLVGMRHGSTSFCNVELSGILTGNFARHARSAKTVMHGTCQFNKPDSASTAGRELFNRCVTTAAVAE